MKILIRIRIFSLLGLILLVSCEKEKRSLPVDADGNTYDTVVIGRQVWLSENLKTTKFNVGTLIPLLPENADWTANGSGACCWYENDINNKDTYGAIYNWYAAQFNTQICPVGYHVSTKEDWLTLISFLKEATIEIEQSFNINQVGFRAWDGSFSGSGGCWWIYSNDGTPYFIGSLNFEIGYGMPKKTGFYVRCVKDH